MITKRSLDRRIDKIENDAFKFILTTIVKYCKKYKWEFSTAYIIYIKDKNGFELDTDKNYLAKLVFWYEDRIRLFPSIIVEPDGTVYPEEFRHIIKKRI